MLQGAGNGPIQTFENLAGPTALQVGAGSRWLVYATDPTGFDTGGLAYDFKRYNDAFGYSHSRNLGFRLPEQSKMARAQCQTIRLKLEGTSLAGTRELVSTVPALKAFWKRPVWKKTLPILSLRR